LTQQGIEPMIYHTQGKHANQYSLEAKELKWRYPIIHLSLHFTLLIDMMALP
jgi:hypothetical protein